MNAEAPRANQEMQRTASRAAINLQRLCHDTLPWLISFSLDRLGGAYRSMSIKRVVPDIVSQRMDESRKFYTDFLGFDVAMDMGWVLTFISPDNPTAQITVVQGSETSMPQPNMSIEVGDVDAVHAKAVALGLPIVYPLTDEPWGVRRFFVADPNGVIINVLSHHK